MDTDAPGIFRGKRLVVFGAGYVGGELARQALACGMRVTALTRDAGKAAALAAIGAEPVVADLADRSWHERIPGEGDFVVNCVSAGGAGLAGYRRSYVDGMASILDWARAYGRPKTIIYTSSTSVYPQGEGAMVDETARTDETSERARFLVEAERMLQGSKNAGGSVTHLCGRWFILRLAGIYGPGRHHLLDQVRAGEIAGRGEHRLNLVHRDDIVAALWAVLAAPATIAEEIFNLADDGAAPKADVTKWLAARLCLPEPRFTGQSVTDRRAVPSDRIISNAKIKSLLGWQPRYPTFREGYESILTANERE